MEVVCSRWSCVNSVKYPGLPSIPSFHSVGLRGRGRVVIKACEMDVGERRKDFSPLRNEINNGHKFTQPHHYENMLKGNYNSDEFLSHSEGKSWRLISGKINISATANWLIQRLGESKGG